MTPRLPTIELRVRGRRTRVLHAGGAAAGVPVVLVHGLGLSADIWRPHLQALAGDAGGVLAPDLPGFGRSDGPLSGMGVDDVARWLLELRAELSLPAAVWVGHSVAAQAVVRLAVLDPAAAAGLVLATPTGDPGRLRWLVQLAGLARTAFHEPPSLVARVLRHYLTTLPSRTVGTWLRARGHDPLADAPAIRCPALIVLGAEDPVVPIHFARALRRGIPDASLAIVPDAAHGAALSHAEAFVNHVRSFLARTALPSSPHPGDAGAPMTRAPLRSR